MYCGRRATTTPTATAPRGLTCQAADATIRSRSRTIHIGVICGGQSAEHDISLRSAHAVTSALAGDHHIKLIYIGRDGIWQTGDVRRFIAAEPGTPPALPAPPPSAVPPAIPHRGELAGAVRLTDLDVVFPVLHGPFGEDGTVQGLLELVGVPYVGAGVLGSAVAMDKDMTKRILHDAGIAVARFTVVREPPSAAATARICADLGLPLFVKPANLGSSVGVHRVSEADELAGAVADALRHDRKVLIEEEIVGRELEVSVLGNERRTASVAGEVVTGGHHPFYDYAAKYLDEDGARLLIPAPLTAAEQARAADLACRACAALEVQGMARVDFFLRGSGDGRDRELLVSEINTIPGFTAISMYAKLWEASGLPLPRLLRRLLDLALERHRTRPRGA